MPNGGVMPCCAVCQWSQKEGEFDARCIHHDLIIYGALSTFCPDLEKEATPGLKAFIENRELAGDDIYIWIEIGYTTKQYPQIPQYYHEYVKLTSIAEYASWTKERIQTEEATIHKMKQKEFLAKYGSKSL